MQLKVKQQAVTRDVAIVKMAAKIGKTEYSGVGCAKRDPGDKPDRQIGVQLAAARALENLALHIRRQADGLVKHHDDMRAQNAERKAKAAALVEELKTVKPKKKAPAKKKTTKKTTAKKS